VCVCARASARWFATILISLCASVCTCMVGLWTAHVTSCAIRYSLIQNTHVQYLIQNVSFMKMYVNIIFLEYTICNVWLEAKFTQYIMQCDGLAIRASIVQKKWCNPRTGCSHAKVYRKRSKIFTLQRAVPKPCTMFRGDKSFLHKGVQEGGGGQTDLYKVPCTDHLLAAKRPEKKSLF